MIRFFPRRCMAALNSVVLTSRAFFVFAGLTLFSASTHAQADDFINWHSESISLLYGGNFSLEGGKKATLTGEIALGYKWGDLFAFTDLQKRTDLPAGQKNTWYVEISPRFSLSKISGRKLFSDKSLFKDLSLGTTYERAENGIKNYLFGPSLDLNVSGFRVLHLTAYARKDGPTGGFDDMQMTLVWKYPFSLGGQSFTFDGYLDYILGLDEKSGHFHTSPQLKWDMGQVLGLEPGKIWFGSEVYIWKNKFGIKDSPALDTNQIAVQALMTENF